MKWDLFISHASEDKDDVVRPLARMLAEGGVRVWFDEMTLRIGDSLRQKIDEGLAHSKHGLVLLSDSFFAKQWPAMELDALIALGSDKRRRILPVWHKVGYEEVASFSPLLAGRLALATAKGLRQVADEIIATIRDDNGRSTSWEISGHSIISQEVTIQIIIPRREILVLDEKYVFIPAGVFLMGSDDGNAHEEPRHMVGISSLFVQGMPVRNRDFTRFVDLTDYVTSVEQNSLAFCYRHGNWETVAEANWRHPYGLKSSIYGKSDHPVVQVSWFDAMAYCAWLSRRTGLEFNLPSEAEWEYAAVGPTGARWSFGDNYLSGQANLEGSNTTLIGTFPPNIHGLYDMTGNVYEWCADWYAPTWQAAGHSLTEPVTHNPIGPSEGTARVLRGGSCLDNAWDGRCANRFHSGPYTAAENWGFRCCLRLSDSLLSRLYDCDNWGFELREMLQANA